MKAFLVLLAVASASAYWPGYTYSGVLPTVYHSSMYPYAMPMITPKLVKAEEIKPMEVKPMEMKVVQYKMVEPEEYTKTMEYKTGMPIWNQWYGKMVKMPEVEMDYAGKGEYEAVAAGGVVHRARRSAWWPTLYHTPSIATHPITYMNHYGYSHLPFYGLPGVPIMPKIVADDTLKEGTPDYANKNEYVADNGVVVHKAKRETNPALLLRTTNGIIPTTRTILGNTGYVSPVVNRMGYTTSGLRTIPTYGYGNTFTNTFGTNTFGTIPTYTNWGLNQGITYY